MRSAGQIYIPFINWGLFVAIVLAVLTFFVIDFAFFASSLLKLPQGG